MATGDSAKTLAIHVKPLTADSIRITWKASLPASSFRAQLAAPGPQPGCGLHHQRP